MSVPSPDALLHLATLHLLSQAGFASTSQAASLTLSSVVGEYFKLVARSTVDRALLAGRSKPGVYDVVASLEDLGYGSSLEDLFEYGASSGRDTLEGEGLEKLAGMTCLRSCDTCEAFRTDVRLPSRRPEYRSSNSGVTRSA